MMKTCTSCKTEKPESEFYVTHARARKKPYRIPYCKACMQAKTKAYNDLHREEKRAAWNAVSRASAERIRQAVFAAYGGYICACCGETERLFLTLDHINNDGSKWREERLGSSIAAGIRTYRWLLNHGCPDGFQVLCMNCNWGKRRSGVCPHRVKRNDYPLVGVGSSEPKRTASNVSDDEIVSSAMKVAAVSDKPVLH